MVIKKHTIEEPSIPRYAMPAIAILMAVTLFMLLTGEVPVIQPQSVSIDVAEAVTNHQDLLLSLDNVTVIIPQGLEDMKGTITIVRREPDLFPFAGTTEWTRPQIFDVEYRNSLGVPQPRALLPKLITICFKLEPPQWQDYQARPSDYQVQYYAEDLDIPRWVALPMTINANTFQLCGQTDHLSLFALAIRLQTSIPLTGATAAPASTAGAPGSDPGHGPSGVPSQVGPTEPSTPAPPQPSTEPTTGPPTEPPILPIPTFPLP